MITFNGMWKPTIEANVEYYITINGISEIPDDEEKFRSAVTKYAAENRVGRYQIQYHEGNKMITVDFSVLIKSTTHSIPLSDIGIESK